MEAPTNKHPKVVSIGKVVVALQWVERDVPFGWWPPWRPLAHYWSRGERWRIRKECPFSELDKKKGSAEEKGRLKTLIEGLQTRTQKRDPDLLVVIFHLYSNILERLYDRSDTPQQVQLELQNFEGNYGDLLVKYRTFSPAAKRNLTHCAKVDIAGAIRGYDTYACTIFLSMVDHMNAKPRRRA